MNDQTTYRSFDDTRAIRQAIFDRAMAAMQARFPLTNERYTLRLADLRYRAPKEYGPQDQKRALMRGRTLGWNMVGKWQLVDNATQKPVDETKSQLLAQVPYMTDRGTFIFNGNEYTLANQMRLRPGVYSRVKENGLLESHFNVKGGTGPSFRVYMEPDTGVFRMHVGQANLKLYPILRSIGLEDRDLNEAWGRDLLHANVAAADPRAVARAYHKLVHEPEPEEAQPALGAPGPVEKAASDKEPKEAVNYISHGTLQQCVQCRNYDDHSCKRVEGHIEPDGWCLLWARSFGKYAQADDANRVRAQFVGRVVCDASDERKPWIYLSVHRGLAEAAWEALHEEEPEAQPKFDLPHITISQGDEAKALYRKYGRKWKTACGHGREIFYSLQNAMVDLTPDGWKDMDRVWFLEARSPQLRAFRKSLGLEELPAGKGGDEHPFHITIAVLPKTVRGHSKIASVFDEYQHRADRAFVKLCEALDEAPDLAEQQALAERALKDNPAAPVAKRQQALATVADEAETAAERSKRRLIALFKRRMEPLPEQLSPEQSAKMAYEEIVGCLESLVKAAADESNYGGKLRETLEKMELDEETTEYTMGKRVKAVSPGLLVDATKRLIDINHKKADTDDRDSLAYQQVFGPEDLFADRISRDAGGLARRLLWKSTLRGKVMAMPGALSPQLRSVLLNSGLAAPLEEVNPLEVYDQLVRVSRMGEGGIPSEDSVPMESRNVQPSHFGFLDPVRAPEGTQVGVDSRLAVGAMKGHDGRLYRQLVDAKTGQPQVVSVQQVVKSVVAFPGELAKKTPTVRAMVNGRTLEYVNRDEVQYELPHSSQIFTATANLVPMVNAIKGGRLLMGAKMSTQALPLQDAESPLVQNASADGRSFERVMGDRAGALFAEGAGVVEQVGRHEIKVNYGKGQVKTYPLYHNFPYNRKSVTGDTEIYIQRSDGSLWIGPIVEYAQQPGDRTLTIDPDTKRSCWLPVLARTEHDNDKRLLQIRLQSGRTMTITEDHSLMVMGERGELVPAYPDQCVVGSTRLPVAMLPVGEGSRDPMTPDEALLGGLYLAEGHIPDTQPNCIGIAVQPLERREQVLQLMTRLGGKPYIAGGSAHMTDAGRAELLRAHFGRLSHAKYVSAAVLAASPVVRLAVLQGYFAGDGCLHTDTNDAVQMVAASVSRRVRDGIAALLSTFGIFSSRGERANEQRNDHWRHVYTLRVASAHIEKLPRWFFYDDRQAKLQQLVKAGYRGSPYELIPVPRGARKLLYSGTDEVEHFVYKAATAGYVAKWRVAGYDGVFGRWGRSDVCWDKIVDIAPAPDEARVYDLTVERAESFAVNGGVVVHNTFLHNSAAVKVGDQVTPGQLLAKSNYTDGSGSIAIGKNLRVGYMAYRGFNADDAIAISESAAKKLTSEHLYNSRYQQDDSHEVGKNPFIAIYPGRFDRRQLERVDDNGVVRVGTVLQRGDPMILALDKRQPKGSGVLHGRKTLYQDVAETWDHDAPGVVTDVDRAKGGWKVLVRAYNPMEVGDKLTGRYGNKGVVAQIIPDDKMPHSADGTPLEVLLNPLGVISRTNPAQLIEAALGKVAKKTGKPYVLPGFHEGSLVDLAKGELQKHGLSDTEDVYDPVSGRKIPKVFTGQAYFMKLHHMAEPKLSGRDVGAYTSEGLPARGGDEGAKRLGGGELSALLSHGATNLIRDAKIVRGQRNDDYWRALRLGYTPPSPRVPVIYDKFLASLQGAGINLKKQGDVTHLYALTDDDIDELSAGPITAADTVDARTLEPVPGGLFDVGKTGGHGGTRWSHVRLAAPMPNPIMEEPIRRLLGLTEDKFLDVLAGKEKIATGTGSQAIQQALRSLRLDGEIERAQSDMREATGARRDLAIKRLGYLETLKKAGIRPEQLMLTKVPVLPPNFRPISAFNGTSLVADANVLYRELMEANEDYDALRKELGEDNAGDERLQVYKAFKAVTGLGDPVGMKSQQQNVKGLLKDVFGASPKIGMFQKRVLGAAVDTVGRGVITPNPSLNMDQVGLPEDKAWVLYRPFIVRRLVRRGMSAMTAAKAVESQSQPAREALVEEMSKRPVVITRAPVLHRYGIMSAWPILTKGHTLQIPPIITPGFNADFDGDQMNFHVPVSDDAVKDAVDKMLPSRNLRAVTNFDVHYYPRQEFLHGLHLASTARKKGGFKTFRSKEDALAAYKRGELEVGDEVDI